MKIYWANLCILNRMEAEKMEAAAEAWGKGRKLRPRMIYLGDTEEVQMYEQMDADMAAGRIGFDLLVSSRFDLFCSSKYLQGRREELLPIGNCLPVREEVAQSGVLDPHSLFHPIVVLPHFIVCNGSLMQDGDCPRSLEELLDPFWSGKVFLGATRLPSAKVVLFAVWYTFGREGLEACVRNWRQKSAPSAARHGLVKNEFPVALLPGIFAGPGPGDSLRAIWPQEGAPVLPSYAAIRKSEYSHEVLDFFRQSVGTKEFSTFYRDQAMAFPASPDIAPPDIAGDRRKMFFPDWDWILKQDMEYFQDACARLPPG